MNEAALSVDGVRIGIAKMDDEDSRVQAVTWSPQSSALDILLCMTFAGTSAAVIVMPEADPILETSYRNEIRMHLGIGTPTRLLLVETEIDESKRTEIMDVFQDLYKELLEKRARSK